MADDNNSGGIRLTPPTPTPPETLSLDETHPAVIALNEQMEESPLILMLDIESLDVGPRSVVTQIALYAFDQDEGSIMDDCIWSFIPIQPQLDLIRPRTISASTLIWWMRQEEAARKLFERNDDEDFGTLGTLMRHFLREFNRITRGRTYELWARGPQFDVVNVETLLADLGLKAPWDYGSVRDLRTLMAAAGLRSADVARPEGFIAHQAGWDCRYQIAQYEEAKRHLRARG